MLNRLNVALCWHMHQPYYRDAATGVYRLPWVYLHGIKDYSDMAAHFEQHPAMRAVVNFTPVLLEQIADYADQLARLLADGVPTQDRMLNLLAGLEAIPGDAACRRQLLRDCQRCHAPRMIHPYPAFSRLLRLAGVTDGSGISPDNSAPLLNYLDDQYFLDVLTWYHMVWLGHSLRELPEVIALFAQQEMYGREQRMVLLRVMQQCLAGLISRYRALAERGQIELSMTPYGHPIIPLMIDFDNMQCSMPDAPRPQQPVYPGGEERSRWHIEHGMAVFEQFFGRKPQGIWFAEGGISEDAVALLDAHQIRWTASGEAVWRGSARLSQLAEPEIQDKRGLFGASDLSGRQTRIFFRDDGLSDLIGFRYSNWHADDAVTDFIQHLENIAAFLGDDASKHCVTIILDGENAWEYYPDNGHHFLDGLYSALDSSAVLQPVTLADASTRLPASVLPRLCAGSWVYGTFSTWIGSPDKNRGWDYLISAKSVYDEAVAAGKLDAAQLVLATRQLAICEGSDWFWWFGDYNPADSVSDFERLYREQLRALYRLVGAEAPTTLDVPLSHGGGLAENAGTMRRNV